jgi:hypothetical protein
MKDWKIFRNKRQWTNLGPRRPISTRNKFIDFLHAKNMSAVESHRELCAVYGQIVMSEGSVKQ